MLLIAVSVLIKAWAAFGSWFYEDDFEFLSVVARGENDLSWYFTRHNVHFMPLSLLLTTPVGLVGDFAWWPAALETTLMNLAAAIACWWMLTRLFGQNPRILAPLVFYLFSPLLIPATTWWAVSINLIAVQAPLFVMIGSHVEYLRTRNRRWLVVAAAMLLLVAGVYVKGLVVTAVLGLFTVCYAVEGGTLVRRVWTALVQWWQIWFVYIALGALTIAVYIHQGDSAENGGLSGVGGLADSLVLHNLFPSLVGGPWTWADMGGIPRQLANPSAFAVSIALAVLVAAFAYAVHRWTNAWLPLVFLAPAILGTFVAMSAFRTGSFPFLGLETRYWADVLPYFVLAFGVSVMPLTGLPEVRRRRVADSPEPPAVVALAVAAAYVVSSLASTLSYVEPWHTDFPARLFVSGALAHADDDGKEVTVADVPAPAAAMSGTFYPYNTPNYLFAPSPGRFSGVDSGVDLTMLDLWGEPQVTQAHGDMSLDVSSQACVGGPSHIDLETRTFDFPFWVTLTATFERTTTLDVAVNSARYTFEVPSGRHLITFRTTGSFDRIWLNSQNGAPVCPESIAIGTELEVP